MDRQKNTKPSVKVSCFAASLAYAHTHTVNFVISSCFASRETFILFFFHFKIFQLKNEYETWNARGESRYTSTNSQSRKRKSSSASSLFKQLNLRRAFYFLRVCVWPFGRANAMIFVIFFFLRNKTRPSENDALMTWNHFIFSSSSSTPDPPPPSPLHVLWRFA